MTSSNYYKVTRFFLYASVFAIAIVSRSTIFPFIVGKYAWFRGSVAFALIAFALGCAFSREAPVYLERLRTVFRSPITIALGVFALSFILAGFFGINPNHSFWSNFERGEGGFQLLTLFVFFVLTRVTLRSAREWRTLLWCLLIGAVLMVAYGFFAGIGVGSFIGAPFNESGFRFAGSIGNPAYVAAYLVFASAYTLYLWVTGIHQKRFSPTRIILIAFGAIFITAFFLANTRGAFIGALVAITVGVAYLMWHHRSLRRWLAISIVALAIAVGGLVYFRSTAFVQHLPIARIFDISLSTRTFGDRWSMWKTAIDGFKERPLLGWGPENFIYVFDKHFNTAYFRPAEGFGAWFDRAHSIFFDYLVEIGIIGLISYLAVFVTYYYRFFKWQAAYDRRSTVVRAILVALPIAYLVQGIVLFDVFPIYINVFLMLALADYHFSFADDKGEISAVTSNS